MPTGIDCGVQRWLDDIRHGQNFHDVFAVVNTVDSPAKRRAAVMNTFFSPAAPLGQNLITGKA
jgi:hypothetical protein